MFIALKIYLRPYCKELLTLLSEFKSELAKKNIRLQLGIWTASTEIHVTSLLAHVDPERIFDFIICRAQDDKIPNWHAKKDKAYDDKKPVELLGFPAILIDNSSTVASVFSTGRHPILTVPDFVSPDLVLVQVTYFLLAIIHDFTTSRDLSEVLLSKSRDELTRIYTQHRPSVVYSDAAIKYELRDYTKNIFLRRLKTDLVVFRQIVYTSQMHPEFTDFILPFLRDYAPSVTAIAPPEPPIQPVQVEYPMVPVTKPIVTIFTGPKEIKEITAALKRDPDIFDSRPRICFKFEPGMSEREMFFHMVEKTEEFYSSKLC